MSFKVEYISNFRNINITGYSGFFIGGNYDKRTEMPRYITNEISDKRYENVVYFDYKIPRVIRIFQADGGSAIYDRKNI